MKTTETIKMYKQIYRVLSTKKITFVMEIHNGENGILSDYTCLTLIQYNILNFFTKKNITSSITDIRERRSG